MNALLLGGNSLRNREWIQRVGVSFSSLFDKITVHDYKHWQEGRPNISFEDEQPILAKEAAALDDYVVFAKSAGSILTVKSIHDGLIAPQKCVFAGTALAMVKNENLDFARWLSAVECPVLFIHNSDDPIASFNELKDYLSENGPTNFEMVELPGETHDYDDLEELTELVKEFVFK